MLEAETIAKVDQARKELQWDSEKRNVALRKLRWFFLDPLEVGRRSCHFRVSSGLRMYISRQPLR